MRLQEVRNGETITIITRSVLILGTIATTATDPNKTNSGQPTRQAVGTKPKDSKITLTQESAHYIPTELSSSFFRQFNLAMKLKWEELRKQERRRNQVNEVTEGDLIQPLV